MYRLANYRYVAVFTVLALVLSFSAALIVPSATAVEEQAAGQETFASSEIAGLDEYGDVGEQFTGGYWQWMLESDTNLGSPVLTVLYDDGSSSSTAGVMTSEGQWIFDVYHDGIDGAPVGTPVSATVDYVLVTEQPESAIQPAIEEPPETPAQNPVAPVAEGTNSADSTTGNDGTPGDEGTTASESTASESVTANEGTTEGGVAAGGGGGPEGGIAAGGEDETTPQPGLQLTLLNSSGIGEGDITVPLQAAHVGANSLTFTQGERPAGMTDPVVWHFILNQAGETSPQARLHAEFTINGSSFVVDDLLSDGAGNVQQWYVGTAGDGILVNAYAVIPGDNGSAATAGQANNGNGNPNPNLLLSHVNRDCVTSGQITITKIFSDGADIDAEFKLTKGTTEIIKTTDNGSVTFDNLEPGDWNLTETAIPGYSSSLPVGGKNIAVAAGSNIEETVTNTVAEAYSVTVYKTFNDGNADEVMVKLYKWYWNGWFWAKDPTPAQSKMTVNHIASFTGLNSQYHYSVEENVPGGYDGSVEPSGHFAVSRLPVVVNILNTKEEPTNGLIVNKTFTDGNTMEVTFVLKKWVAADLSIPSGNWGSWTLDSTITKTTVNHTASFDNLETTGEHWSWFLPFHYKVKYTLSEVVPPGYESSWPDDTEIIIGTGAHYGGSTEVAFCPYPSTVVDVENWPCTGRLEINKYFEDGSVPDPGFEAEFGLFDGTTQLGDSQFANGTTPALFDPVTPGTYTVRELNIPDGWTCSIPEGASVTIAAGCTTSLDVTNYKDGGLDVDKTLYTLLKPEGAKHEGITFHLEGPYPAPDTSSASPAPIPDQTTDVNGYCLFPDLPPGYYFLTEVNLPDDLTCSLGNGEWFEVGAGLITHAFVDNRQVPDGSIVVHKVYNDSNTAEVDLELWGEPQVFQSPVATLTNSGGSVILMKSGTTTGLVWIVSDLPPGDYTLVENPVPGGYNCPDNNQTVTVPGEGYNEYYIHNNYIPGRIIVNKDFDPNSSLTATFTLMRGASTVDSGTISGDGSLTFDNLAPGTYTLYEDGIAGWTSSISGGESVTVTSGADTTVNVTNHKRTGDGGPGGDDSYNDEPETPTTETSETPAETEVTPEVTAVTPQVAEVTPQQAEVVPVVTEAAPAETALPKTGAESVGGIIQLAMMLASSGAILRRVGRK